MSALLPINSSPRNAKAVPAIAVWLTLSILLHLALMIWMPRLHKRPDVEPAAPPLTVTLLPQPEAAPPPEPPPAPPVVVTPPQPKVRPPRQPPPRVAKAPPPPVIALNKPKAEEPPLAVPTPKVEETPAPPPQAAAPPPQVAPPPAPPAPAAPKPAEPDLTAYIEAQRRARGEAPADTTALAVERANRGVLNSAALKEPVPTNFTPQKPRNGYGSFEIRRRGFDYAEFMFKGWNENFRRNGLELNYRNHSPHRNRRLYLGIPPPRTIIDAVRAPARQHGP
jgi:outer membrane biosynthesis protein TonB